MQRQASGWLLVLFLGGALGGMTACKDPRAARLAEARADLEAATQLKDKGEYPNALLRGTHALVLLRETLGDTHLEVASAQALLGRVYCLQGHWTEAESHYQQALALRKLVLGPNHPDVASSLNDLANVSSDQGFYDRAEALYTRALTIREAVLGENHPDVAASLDGLAILYSDQGFYDRAEVLHTRALSIREAVLGENHPDVAASLNNLAMAYVEQGLYSRAEPLCERTLAIREKVLGENHPDVASALLNLGGLYQKQGLYSRAESFYMRALTLYERTLGRNHPLVAMNLNNLAILYLEQGLYGRAAPLLERALVIQETTFGRNHPNVADSLSYLFALYFKQGSYAQAERLLERALAIQEATLGKSHPSVVTSLINLSELYIKQGLYRKAELLSRRALASQEDVLGERHPDVAFSLNNLALISLQQGTLDQAASLARRALSLQEEALGKSHPLLSMSLQTLARIRVAQQRLAEALPLFEQDLALSEQRLRQEALDFSESRLSDFLLHLRDAEQTLYSVSSAYPKDARMRRLALSAVLMLKGRSVEETAHTSYSIYRELGAEDRDAFARLRGLRARLASLSFEGAGALAPEEYQRRLKALADECDALEANLAKRSTSLRALLTRPSPEDIVERVAASLPPDSALVEFVAYEARPPIPSTTPPEAGRAPPLRYLALVLFPDATTRAVDLGPTAPIDAAATRLRSVLSERSDSFLSSARELHRRAFQPLVPLLGSTRRLLLSPDGQLGLVPFAALHDGRDFVVDSFDVTYLSSGRELLPRPQGSASSAVFVFADPQFSAAAPAAPAASSRPGAIERFFSRSDIPRGVWEELKGTREEAAAIQRLLPQAQLFLGPLATKERLLQLPTPLILHIATHGFFLGDVPRVPFEDERDVVSLDVVNGPPPAQQEPLLNSGLALSGASTSRSDATLVTALELAGLDLWGTQLVVLSACDTGRGEVQLGQGIQGMRRALMVAGAETVVTSLWRVNDGSTRLLMEDYYRNLLAGQGRASALREAMRSLRRTHPHPYHWASFIALGSDAPLRGLGPTSP